jgi:hypothetical protein
MTGLSGWVCAFIFPNIKTSADCTLIYLRKTGIFPIYDRLYGLSAGVAELADALDLGSSAARRVGSSPSARTSLRPFGATTWQASLERAKTVTP